MHDHHWAKRTRANNTLRSRRCAATGLAVAVALCCQAPTTAQEMEAEDGEVVAVPAETSVRPSVSWGRVAPAAGGVLEATPREVWRARPTLERPSQPTRTTLPVAESCRGFTINTEALRRSVEAYVTSTAPGHDGLVPLFRSHACVALGALPDWLLFVHDQPASSEEARYRKAVLSLTLLGYAGKAMDEDDFVRLAVNVAPYYADILSRGDLHVARRSASGRELEKLDPMRHAALFDRLGAAGPGNALGALRMCGLTQIRGRALNNRGVDARPIFQVRRSQTNPRLLAPRLGGVGTVRTPLPLSPLGLCGQSAGGGGGGGDGLSPQPPNGTAPGGGEDRTGIDIGASPGRNLSACIAGAVATARRSDAMCVASSPQTAMIAFGSFCGAASMQAMQDMRGGKQDEGTGESILDPEILDIDISGRDQSLFEVFTNGPLGDRLSKKGFRIGDDAWLSPAFSGRGLKVKMPIGGPDEVDPDDAVAEQRERDRRAPEREAADAAVQNAAAGFDQAKTAFEEAQAQYDEVANDPDATQEEKDAALREVFEKGTEMMEAADELDEARKEREGQGDTTLCEADMETCNSRCSAGEGAGTDVTAPFPELRPPGSGTGPSCTAGPPVDNNTGAMDPPRDEDTGPSLADRVASCLGAVTPGPGRVGPSLGTGASLGGDCRAMMCAEGTAAPIVARSGGAGGRCGCGGGQDLSGFLEREATNRCNALILCSGEDTSCGCGATGGPPVRVRSPGDDPLRMLGEAPLERLPVSEPAWRTGGPALRDGPDLN